MNPVLAGFCQPSRPRAFPFGRAHLPAGGTGYRRGFLQPTTTKRRDKMTQGAVDMCRRFAVQHIGYWRDAKRQGLRKLAAENRAAALWWLAKIKGRK